MEEQKLQRIHNNIQGHLQDVEIEYLHDSAANVKIGCIVEIGSFKGKSTVSLAMGAPNGIRIYAIDPHYQWPNEDGKETVFGPEDRRYFMKNILEFEVWENVYPINLPSEVPAKGWQEKISFLFIDGDHSYKGCKNDFLNWNQHVKSGGIISFHDADKDHIGVPDVIDEVLENYPYEVVKEVGGIKSLIKVN